LAGTGCARGANQSTKWNKKQLKRPNLLEKRMYSLVSCLACLFLLNAWFPAFSTVKSQPGFQPNLKARSSFNAAPAVADPGARRSVVNSASGVPVQRRLMSWFEGDNPLASLPLASPPQDMVVEKVFAPTIFSFPVIQQPVDSSVYVSPLPDWVTQYRPPTEAGVTALIAHNYLAGQKFYDLKVGQQVWLFYEDHTVRPYIVTSVNKFRKVSPTLLTSDLVNLETQEVLTSNEAYDRYYTGPHHLTLQTCLEGNGRLDYGLTFIVAEPQP
jgi:hypothetical protein